MLLARLRSLGRDERGVTLVELVVAMLIFSIVSLVFTTTLSAVQRAVVREEVRTRLNDDARLALQSIDRQVRSGNVLYDPDSETGNDPYDAAASGYMFRVYTQAKANDADNPRCVVWLIDDQERLKSMWWPPYDPDAASGWTVVADSIVNRTLDTPAFAVDSLGRTVTVAFQVNPALGSDPNATQPFTASVTGRNTSYGYPETVCDDLPDLT